MKSFKIDLHSQTDLSKKNGDKISFLKADVLNGWKKEKVKFASFTDKNTFDFNFYKEWKEVAKQVDTILIPGIEIIIKKDGYEQDMILNFSDELSDEKLKEIEKILKLRSSTFFSSFEEVIKIFDKFNPIYIPHIGKSHNNCRYETLKDNLDKIFIIESTNLNNSNHKKFMKMTNDIYKDKIVHFSDTHRWTNYPEYGLKNVFFEPINNFNELYDFLKYKKIKILK